MFKCIAKQESEKYNPTLPLHVKKQTSSNVVKPEQLKTQGIKYCLGKTQHKDTKVYQKIKQLKDGASRKII